MAARLMLCWGATLCVNLVEKCNARKNRIVHTLAAQHLPRRIDAIRGIAATIHHIQRIVHNLAAQHLHKLL